MPGKEQPSDIDVHLNAGRVAVSRFQCSFPAVVTALEAEDGRVQVQPAIRIRAASGQQVTPNPVTIPVAWPSWGDIVIQGVLAINDEVLVRCQDKNWAAWLLTGGVVDDLAPGGHQSGYAVAEPTQVSLPRRPSKMAPTDVLRIGRKDGLTTVVLRKDGSIILQGTDVFLSSGTGLGQFLTDFHTQFNAWAPAPNDGGLALDVATLAWQLLAPPTGGTPPP